MTELCCTCKYGLTDELGDRVCCNGNSANAGNVKLNGKKTKLLPCGCCEAVNFKNDYEMKLMLQEIDKYSTQGKLEDEID